MTDVPSLQSNQEEADTRIILHAVAAANSGANNIVVRSPDTDVLVLLLHHRPDIHAEKIYFLTGRSGKHANLTRFVPVHSLYDMLTNISIIYCYQFTVLLVVISLVRWSADDEKCIQIPKLG